ncbi:MAG: hypothetical protein HZB25_00400 [Candidatus Eisenbacteria bacterium]|nr:hypothetical protein [Candidatus Eisenbacteria bacterium]
MTQLVANRSGRRAALARELENARAELAEMKASLDRYERGIEVPRLLGDIRRMELEIQKIDVA